MIYSDLKLDLTFNELTERPLNAKESTKDIQKIINGQSVLNALRNILTTNQGDRLLDPGICVDLRSFLFEPLTLSKAHFIAVTLKTTIPQYEPRVSVENVHVGVNFEDSSYLINMSVGIPTLGATLSFSTILSATAYSID